ncbi:MAG TPA: glutamate--cysteine ligase, partial [Thiotrichales bacterium]|nr:glutamate--cysteine ligase [Thiotrichales bacterium]
MGEEIQYSRFNQNDYRQFEQRLADETDLLRQWFEQQAFARQPLVAGYELEAWLINAQCQPCPDNDRFLDRADNALLSAELARFNVELNVEPEAINASLLQHFEQQLSQLWSHCQQSANAIDCRLLGAGILPTLKDEDLSLKNISSLQRYKALNEQVLRHQRGATIKLNINGAEHLQVEHKDVMLEAAATSLQIHLQVPQALAVRYYNASIIVSSIMVAVGANSPFLFNKQLWEETRIPVFEQSVPTGGLGGAASGPVHRVSFGSDYARESLFECFLENQQHFPVLLPVSFDRPLEQLRHLRLHNGTIWRWNRPLIGFEEDGTPHLRIEHRVIASAPSTLDNIANIAFYYGLVEFYASQQQPPENLLTFADAKDNFYRAAQLGLKHRLRWTDNERHTLQQLVLDRLLLEAEAGLYKLGIDESQSKKYLGIIEARVKSAQTGSAWQQAFAHKHRCDMTLLTRT